MKFAVCLFALMLPGFCLGEKVSYCEDPEVVKDWNRKVEQHRHSDNWQKFHALWLGLCQKVREGSITFERARLFEEERRRIYRLEERLLLEPSPPFGMIEPNLLPVLAAVEP